MTARELLALRHRRPVVLAIVTSAAVGALLAIVRDTFVAYTRPHAPKGRPPA